MSFSRIFKYITSVCVSAFAILSSFFFSLHVLEEKTSDISFTWENFSHLLFQTSCQRAHTSIPRRIVCGRKRDKDLRFCCTSELSACLCVCERERDRNRETARQRERGGRERENKRGEDVLLCATENHSCLVTLLVICYRLSARGRKREERRGCGKLCLMGLPVNVRCGWNKINWHVS